MEVTLYARISPDDSNNDSDTQLSTLRKFAAAQGWLVTRKYIESTATHPEPLIAWGAMLAAAHNHCFQGVVLFNLKGAFRSPKHMYDTIMTLDAYQISFHSLRKVSIRGLWRAVKLSGS